MRINIIVRQSKRRIRISFPEIRKCDDWISTQDLGIRDWLPCFSESGAGYGAPLRRALITRGTGSAKKPYGGPSWPSGFAGSPRGTETQDTHGALNLRGLKLKHVIRVVKP